MKQKLEGGGDDNESEKRWMWRWMWRWTGRWMGGEVAQGEVGLQVSAGGVLGDPCQAEEQNFN